MNSNKTILDLCGGTGSWSNPYIEAGYNVINVTTPTYDVRTFNPLKPVHGILAAPPCTEFSGSGARWWADKDPALLVEALEIFDACIRIIKECAPQWWALENPVGRLKRLRYTVLGEPTLIFNPCDFGDLWTKKTLLWGNFNIPVYNKVEGKEFWGWRMLGGKSEKTKMLRSMTPPGFAKAFFKANP